MVEQLEPLLAVGARSWVRLQVLPLATPRALLTDSLTILSFADSADTDVAYFSGVRGHAVRQEREAEVRATYAAFDQFCGAALSSSESADLISNLLRQVTE
jgi:hypothetical protein